MAELKLISMDEVPVEEVQWLWYPYIPYGKLTIIHGDPGEGKTTLILQLAALLSRGEPLPCDDRPQEPVKIIYQTAEDGLGDTIKPRLLAGNADCSQIKVIDETDTALTLLDERVEQAIVMTGAKVMILDPVQAYVGTGMDMNRASIKKTITFVLFRSYSESVSLSVLQIIFHELAYQKSHTRKIFQTRLENSRVLRWQSEKWGCHTDSPTAEQFSCKSVLHIPSPPLLPGCCSLLRPRLFDRWL